MKKILTILAMATFVMVHTQAQSAYWEPSKDPYGGYFSLVTAPGDTLYAVENYEQWEKTYRSTDSGRSWQQLTFLQSFFPNELRKRVKITPTGSIYLYIPSQDAYYKTTNDGQSWSPTYSFELELANGVMLKRENSKILRSTNSGQNWTTVLNFPSGVYNHFFGNTPFGGLVFTCYRTLANGDNIISLYRSFDDGITWSSQDVDPSLNYFFYASTNTILCTKQDTLMVSLNGGATFQSTGQFDIGTPSFTVLPSGRILLQGYNGNLYSDDEGITWDTLTPWNYGIGDSYYPIPALTDGTIFKASQQSVIRSTDGGLTWQFSSIGMRANNVLRILFATDSIYYAYTYIGLFKTSDAGENWSLLGQEGAILNASDYYGITNTGGMVISDVDTLLWSPDGETFSNITPPNGLKFGNLTNNLHINPLNNHFYLNTLRGVERSVDFGQTWELLLDSIYFFGGIAFHPSGRIIGFSSSTAGDVWISDNNGISWVEDTIPGNPYISTIRVAPNGDVYAISINSNNSASIWKSEDAGESWLEISQNIDQTLWWLPIFEIGANGHLFIALNQDIFLSVNDGRTWQNLTSPVDSLSISQNYGRIKSLAISPDQHLYVGTEHRGLFKSTNPISQGAFIEGFVRLDEDQDCSTPDGQSPLANRSLKAEGSDGPFYTKTDPLGRYVFFVDTGSYNISLQNLNPIWWEHCDSIQQVELPAYNTRDTADFSELAIADCPLMTVQVSIPMLRRCFDNLIYVYACNQGTVTADSAWVDVTLDPYLEFVSSPQPLLDLGNNVFRFFLGNVESGGCRQFYVSVKVNCDSTVLGQTHCVYAHGYPDTLCTLTPEWSGANIEARASCQDTSVVFKLKNTGSSPSQPLNYIIIEDDVVMFQGLQQYNIDQELVLPVMAEGHTYRIESEQEPGHPFSTLALAFSEGCGGFESLGFINQFTVNGINPSWHRVCRENTGSFDPNDKQGYPIGTGAEHKIRPGQPIDYMIRFQNTGTDTAFTVVVRDTLSPWLDPASLVPAASSHAYTWKLEGAGIVTFTFSQILLPDSTTNLAGSQGFVTFHIEQQAEVPLGAQILNEAAIYFDFNAPVITNQTLHTVGIDLLTSTNDILKPRVKPAIQVSPNPAGAFAVFEWEKGAFKGQHLELFDLLGKTVFSTEVHGQPYVLPRNDLKAGAYGWRMMDQRGVSIGSGMVVFQ